jgi:hypothetical protein
MATSLRADCRVLVDYPFDDLRLKSRSALLSKSSSLMGSPLAKAVDVILNVSFTSAIRSCAQCSKRADKNLIRR